MTEPSACMHRCFDLALRGAGAVSPNPMVGAVLVHRGRIIGEGWHARYGEAHAEVNAVRSVTAADRVLIPESTLFCSLEPCFHFGKTPPCVDLVLAEKIPHVVISNIDPNPLTAGKSIEKLRAAGVAVEAGVLETEGAYLNRAFFTWIREKRPHIVLKWAQSADGFLGRPGERTAISGALAQRLTHRWRGEVDAILVGTTTALTDDPRLDTRFFPGRPPLRIALDFSEKIPPDAHLLDDSQPTWIIGPARAGNFQKTHFHLLAPEGWIPALLEKLSLEKQASLLVEGGAKVLGQFLEAGLWDEIRVLENPRRLGGGIPAPVLPPEAVLRETLDLGGDRGRVFLKSD